MSINHFSYKIKSKLGIDNATILYLFIIIGVGIASFGLGHLSAGSNIKNITTDDNLIIDKEYENSNNEESIIILNKEKEISTDITGEKVYVASKNGKLYYSISCSGAKRIKEENKVWFANSTDAEKSGYSYATSCN